MKNYWEGIITVVLLIITIFVFRWSNNHSYKKGLKRGVEVGIEYSFDTITGILNKAADDTAAYKLRLEHIDTVEYTIRSKDSREQITQEYQLDDIKEEIVDGEKQYHGHRYILYHFPSEPCVTIERLSVNVFSGEIIFDGSIPVVEYIETKNKSEFKKLITKLKIGE